MDIEIDSKGAVSDDSINRPLQKNKYGDEESGRAVLGIWDDWVLPLLSDGVLHTVPDATSAFSSRSAKKAKKYHDNASYSEGNIQMANLAAAKANAALISMSNPPCF